jgi:cysteine desulfurase/selenocysteine lyase
MDENAIRKDFPILKNVIYLDSASTSLTPEPVLEAALDYYHSYKANVGRGVYRNAQIADQRYREAHHKAAQFVSGDGPQGMTVFTRNTTESINIVACGLKWKRGDRIVTTLLEHHSNFLPWMRLRDRGVDLKVVKPDKNGRLELADLERAIGQGARLVAASQLSNALGTVLPIKEIGKICQENGAALLVDGAQSVPHMPVDVKDINCDFLCFSGHKMLAPMGAGVLWMKKKEEAEGGKEVEPLMVGGGMVQEVRGCSSDGCCWDGDYDIKPGYEGYEAGTPDISAGIGLGRAVDYLTRVRMEEIQSHEKRLTARLLEGLQEIKGVRIYGPDRTSSQEKRGGVVSFAVEGLLPHEVALMLDQAAGISVRSGHHCCIPLMKHLGLKYGTVRASLYLYNTEDEIEKLLAAVEQIARMA